jgi:hypothetical protein
VTGPTLADTLGGSQSKVPQIETGKQMPNAQEVEQWAHACRADADATQELLDLLSDAQLLHTEWRQRVLGGQAGVQHDYDKLARNATVVRNFESVVVPGLLQTAAYARCRFVEGVTLHDADPAGVEPGTAERMKRQRVLWEPGRRFEFVVTEAVLRQLLCPPHVMREQFERLHAVAGGVPKVWFGIVPFSVELERTPQHGFILFDEIGIVENFVDELTTGALAPRDWPP